MKTPKKNFFDIENQKITQNLMLPNLILTNLGRKGMQKHLLKTLKPPSKTFKTTKKNTTTLTKTDFPLQVSQWSKLGVFPVS